MIPIDTEESSIGHEVTADLHKKEKFHTSLVKKGMKQMKKDWFNVFIQAFRGSYLLAKPCCKTHAIRIDTCDQESRLWTLQTQLEPNFLLYIEI
jgi:hypothetical protein